MPKKLGRDIVRRFNGNPIVTVEDLDFRCADIRNAGAVRVGKRYILLTTIQSLEGYNLIYPAWSDDGYAFEVGDTPIMEPVREGPRAIYEDHGVLDARIVELDPLAGNYLQNMEHIARQVAGNLCPEASQ